jgi:P27 family predicted phage terminase small subunit
MTTSTALPAPADLSDVAREKWEELAPQLPDRCKDIPAELLADLLRQYCQAFAMRQLAVTELVREGSLLATANNGTRYVSPHLKVIEQAEKAMDRVFRRLGMALRKGEDEPGDIEV